LSCTDIAVETGLQFSVCVKCHFPLIAASHFNAKEIPEITEIFDWDEAESWVRRLVVLWEIKLA
jgi:hypothetical protein